MHRYRILAVLFSLATLVCASSIALAEGTANNTSGNLLTGVISSNGVDDGSLSVGKRTFAVGKKTVIISPNNKITSYRHLRRGMRVSLSFQPRGDYQFPLILSIKILH